MKLLFLILITLCFYGCASSEKEVLPSGLSINELKPNKGSALMRQNMLHLAQIYDLTPFLFTKTINIESGVIPHSHPVLTLNTRNAEHPKKILSVWLHEELHWWAVANKVGFDMAMKELSKIYPKKNRSTYLHLLICHLELDSLKFYLGKKEARGIIYSIMKKDKIYPWVYQQVLYKDKALLRIIKKYHLRPTPLT